MSIRFCALGERGGSIIPDIPELPADDIRIAASVGSGGSNRRSDVVLIQSLLNQAPAGGGGSAKPLKVDGIAGPLTIAAIRRFQTANLGFQDGRIDPGGQTLARLSALAPRRGPSGGLLLGFALTGAPAPAAAPKPTPLAAAIAATPTARLWTAAATLHLTGLQRGLVASGGVIFIPSIFNVVNTHFHLDRDASNLLTNLGKAIGVFSRISTMLSDPTTFYREGPETEKSKFADAPMGGFSEPEPNHHITIRTQYPDCGPNCQAAMLVHEGAHFCGGRNEIRHFAHEFPLPNGEPQDGSTHNYEQMTADEGLKNAASYAAFAIHAFFLQDFRFGLDKKSQ